MAFTINYDSILARIKEVSEIDSEIVYFVQEHREDCEDCDFDPIYGQSTNNLCRTCGGKGEIIITEKKAIVSSVNRVNGTENIYQPGGRLRQGAVIVTVHADQLTENGFKLNQDWIKSVKYIEVGEIQERYYIGEKDDVIPQTLQGKIYEIIFHLSRVPGGQSHGS